MENSLLTFDFSDIKQMPNMYICKPNDLTILGKIIDAYNINLNIKLGQINELSFSIPYYKEINHEIVKNPIFDLLKNRYLIKFQYENFLEYFIIDVPEDISDDNSMTKNLSCYSYAYSLTDDIVTYSNEESYSQNATEILNTILIDTFWSVGYIDASFDLMYRNFSFESKSCLDCCYDIATTFSAVITFDTINYKVNLYNLDNFGLDRGLTFNYGKYIKNISSKINTDNFATKLMVYGKDNLTISSANITGSPYLLNYMYFIYPFERHSETGEVIKSSDYMSDGLCGSLLDYDSMISQHQGEFSSLTSQKIDLREQVNTESENLNTLNTEMLVILDSLDIAQANNLDTEDLLLQRDSKQEYIDNKKKEINSLLFDITIDTPCTSSGNILLYLNDITMNIPLVSGDNTTAIALKICDYINDRYYNYDNKFPLNSTFKAIYNGNNIINIIHYTTEDKDILYSYFIDTDNTGFTCTFSDNVNNGLENQIANINYQIDSLTNLLSLEENFTEDELFELKKFTIKREIRNDYISDVDQLYEWSKKSFEDMYYPPRILELSIIDLFRTYDTGCQLEKGKVCIGENVKILYDQFNVNVSAKIIELDLNFDSNEINLTISSIKEISKDKDKFLKLINQSISTSVQLDANKSSWGGITSANNEIANILDIFRGNIKNEINFNVNNSIQINERGIYIANELDPLKYIIIQSGVIALTMDGGNTWKTAITPTHIVGDVIMGNLLCGINLKIDASNGDGKQFFTVDETGFKIYNMILSIIREDEKMRVNIDGENGIVIEKKNGSTWDNPIAMFSVDTNGVLNIRELKILNTQGNTVLNISGENNEINFDNFLSKFGTIKADNLYLNGAKLKDSAGTVTTEINTKGQILNTTNSGLNFIDRDGINAIVIKGEPNKCYGSNFEAKDNVTNIPNYWSGGQCSTEAVFSGTYSLKLIPNEISQQQQVNNEGFVDSSWMSGQDARISFRQKFGMVRVICLRQDGIPLTLTDDSMAEIVYNEDGSETINNLRTGASLDFTYVDEWRNGYRSFKVDLSSYPIGKFYIKFQNIDATNPTYLDQVQIESNYLNKSTIYSDGPRSFSVSELPIDLVSEDFIADWNSSGVIFNFVKMYTDYPNAQIKFSYSNRSEITTQITFSYSPIITNIDGIDYYTGITVYPDGSNLPSSITNGKINAIIFSRGMVNQ